MKKYTITILLFSLSLGFLFSLSQAQAQVNFELNKSLSYHVQDDNFLLATRSNAFILASMINLAISVFFLIMLIVSGVRWLVFRNISDKSKKIKKRFFIYLISFISLAIVFHGLNYVSNI